MKRIGIHIWFLLLSVSLTSMAQVNPLHQLVEKIHRHQQNTLQEKVFVHVDRTFYVGGETMWFKVYLVDGYFHQPLDLSQVVYLEVLDRNQRAVLQTKIQMTDGLGEGSVSIPASLESDNYTLRAYTRWMKNFSPDFFFHQTISIVNTFQRLEEKNKTPDSRLDVQFFPEGGHLVDGIKSKVAFRVVDPSGKGIPFSGSVLSKKGDTLLTFDPLKFGMGHFTFTPHASEEYRVVIREKNGKITTTQLPPIQPRGYVLSVTDTTDNQLQVVITGDDRDENSDIYLIGHNREIIKSAVALKLDHGKGLVLLDKKTLGDGIVHLTLFNQYQQPVCERLYFNRPFANASLQVSTDKPVYEPRDKITLALTIKSDQPDFIHASVSVFKIDSLQQIPPADIQSYLWLSSELKGNIESPAYYFSDDIHVDEALENLLLTQGWSRFKWDELLDGRNKADRFIAEYRGHLISGKIVDIPTSRPVMGIPVYLGTPDKKIYPYLAHSDSSGRVIFETNHITGNRKLFVQTDLLHRNLRIEIESPFSQANSTMKIPYLALSEKVKENLTQRSISMQAEDIFYHGRALSRNRVADSSAFYGVPSEHYLLDDYTRFPLMEEVMREYVKGVRLRKKDDKTLFRVVDARRVEVLNNDPLVLLDGVAVFETDKIMEMDPLKIKTIDVMTSRYFLGEFYFDGVISLKTYEADLGGFQFGPGTITLDYDGLQQKKEFYSPKYETPAARQSRLPDQRNLLLWIPDLAISAENKNIELYSSDQTGAFRVIIQGVSQKGQPVYQTHSFEVKEIHQ